MPRLRASILLTLLACAGCTVSTHQPVLRVPGSAPEPARNTSVKVHLRSGEMLLLDRWTNTDSTIGGFGYLFRPDRTLARWDSVVIPVDSIALIEAVTRQSHFLLGKSLLATWTVLWGSITFACVMDPKSCFGSCPTFYATDGDRQRPLAEGFSGSIARILEGRDVDALYHAAPKTQRYELTMMNEALETHAVRSLRLLAARRPRGGRVFLTTTGEFRAVTEALPALACVASEGDCRAAVSAMDGTERRSPSDSSDLAAREAVELEFPALAGPLGLVIGARQGLISTHVFYQTIAYLGRGAGEWLAALERAEPAEAEQAMAMARLLGGIDVAVADERGDWLPAGTFDEAGPIAADVAVIPLPVAGNDSPVRVRLTMAKGHWRLDHAALVTLGAVVEPVVLLPVTVSGPSGPDTAAFRLLNDPTRYLVTYPGDWYAMAFDLPGSPGSHELFLESQGYYYEWMRSEWLAEEDPALALWTFQHPAEALRRLAQPFKRVEPEMERLFWESRFRR